MIFASPTRFHCFEFALQAFGMASRELARLLRVQNAQHQQQQAHNLSFVRWYDECLSQELSSPSPILRRRSGLNNGTFDKRALSCLMPGCIDAFSDLLLLLFHLQGVSFTE